MKLELKHLAGYLPYDLQFYKKSLHLMYNRNGVNYLADKSKKARFISIYNKGERVTTTAGTFYLNSISVYHRDDRNKYFEYIKPILRPLSDLAKEIEVNGEKFVPIGYIPEYCLEYHSRHGKDRLFDNWANTECVIEYIKPESLSYTSIQLLLEWHFDIHNLIENNLAIDINELI